MNNTFWKNKKKILVIIYIFLAVILVFLTSQFISKRGEKKVIVEKQKTEEQRQQRMSTAAWSRVSFFESFPVNVTMEIPSYLEGNYRIIKTSDRVDFLYIKNPELATPMLSVKIAKQGELQLAEGEKELKSDCSNYSFAFKLYPSDSYAGQDKEGFAQAIYDFSFFLAGEQSFKCFPRQ